jgi:photosystem II stability/assembly factor-like uncharacterized protein
VVPNMSARALASLVAIASGIAMLGAVNQPLSSIGHRSPTSNQLTGVAFNSPAHGFIVGGDGTFMETTNGGRSWTARTLNLQSPHDPLYAVSFQDAQHAFVLGNYPDIFRTVDGGVTWSRVMNFPYGGSWYHVDFVSSAMGFMGANGALVTTRDGGTNWKLVQNPNTPVVYGMSFLDQSVGLIGGQVAGTSELGVFRTVDRGRTWDNVFSPGPAGANDVLFLSNNVAIAGGAAFYRSVDGGRSWMTVSAPLRDAVSNFARVSERILAAVGTNGTVWRSTDAGRTWSLIQGPVGSLARWAISFVDARHGWIVGPNGFIERTSNGGISWHIL